MALPDTASGQTPSAYVPLDYPLLPLFEHLVARADIEDPSPMVRPFRQSEALLALSPADTVGPSRLAAQVQRLAAAFDTLPAEAGWAIATRAGIQAYTTPCRDILRPVGPGISIHTWNLAALFDSAACWP